MRTELEKKMLRQLAEVRDVIAAIASGSANFTDEQVQGVSQGCAVFVLASIHEIIDPENS